MKIKMEQLLFKQIVHDVIYIQVDYNNSEITK